MCNFLNGKQGGGQKAGIDFSKVPRALWVKKWKGHVPTTSWIMHDNHNEHTQKEDIPIATSLFFFLVKPLLLALSLKISTKNKKDLSLRIN